MNVQTVAVVIMAVSLVAVDAQQREQAYKLQALAQHIGQGSIVRPVVVRVQSQHAAGQSVHHILAGSFHNDIPHKAGGQGAVSCQHLFETLQFLMAGQLVKQQQIGGLLEAECLILRQSSHQILHVIAPVEQTTVIRHLCAILGFGGTHVRDIGKSGQHTFSVQISQTPLYLILGKKLCIDDAGLL